MANELGAALITGGLGFLGGTLSGIESRKAAKEYNKGQMELAKYQYEQNLQQWQRENDYNSPAAQMQRYRDANLNPNLIYGQQNLSASSPEMSKPELMPVTGAAKGLQSGTNSLLAALQNYFTIKQMHEQTKGLRLDNDNKAVDLENKLYFNDVYRRVTDLDWTYKEQTANRNINQASLEADVRRANFNWLLHKMGIDTKMYKDMTQAKYDLLQSQVQRLDYQSTRDQALLPYQQDLMWSQYMANLMLNNLRDVEYGNKDSWKGIGFQNGHFTGNARQFKDLYDKVTDEIANRLKKAFGISK